MVGQVCVIQTTLPGSWLEAEVGALCQQILEAGAACVQHSTIHSIYRWEGETQASPEWHLQIKVDPTKRDTVISILGQKHPYEVPQIVWSTVESTDAYTSWVESQ